MIEQIMTELQSRAITALGGDMSLALQWEDGICLEVFTDAYSDSVPKTATVPRSRVDVFDYDGLHTAARQALGDYTALSTSVFDPDGRRVIIKAVRV